MVLILISGLICFVMVEGELVHDQGILHLLSGEGLRENRRSGEEDIKRERRESGSGGNQTLFEHVLLMKYQ